MKNESVCLVFYSAAFLFLTGYDAVSLQSRLTGHSKTWKNLSVVDRERLLQGDVRVGDTEEMVLIACDKPRRKVVSRKAGEEKQSIWVYERVMRSGNSGEPVSMPPPIQGSNPPCPTGRLLPRWRWK